MLDGTCLSSAPCTNNIGCRTSSTTFAGSKVSRLWNQGCRPLPELRRDRIPALAGQHGGLNLLLKSDSLVAFLRRQFHLIEGMRCCSSTNWAQCSMGPRSRQPRRSASRARRRAVRPRRPHCADDGDPLGIDVGPFLEPADDRARPRRSPSASRTRIDRRFVHCRACRSERPSFPIRRSLPPVAASVGTPWTTPSRSPTPDPASTMTAASLVPESIFVGRVSVAPMLKPTAGMMTASSLRVRMDLRSRRGRGDVLAHDVQ